MTSRAAFIKESRMNFVEPIALNRKSGEVEGSAVLSTNKDFIALSWREIQRQIATGNSLVTPRRAYHDVFSESRQDQRTLTAARNLDRRRILTRNR